MPIEQLTESELNAEGVVSLPTRPNGDYSSGGEALSATELKERFDRLPRYIAARLNQLIALVNADPSNKGDEAIADLILTGMFPSTAPEHTLADLFSEILNGDLAGYLSVGTGTLADRLAGKADAVSITSFSDDELTPESGTEYRCGTVTELELSLPASPSPAFRCTLVFDTPTGDRSAALDYPEGIRWSGDDVADGAFTPAAGRHYTVSLWYDGAWEAAVRGVDL